MKFIKKILPPGLKHFIKSVLGKSDPTNEFFRFQKNIHPQTWHSYKNNLRQATIAYENKDSLEIEAKYLNSPDPLVKQGYLLQRLVLEEYKNKYLSMKDLRVLIHIPPSEISPGGYSLFNNLYQSLSYLGIQVEKICWGQPTAAILLSFQPTVFLTSDSGSYLDQINWDEINKYRENKSLKIGLTASLEEYGNTPLEERLEWAKEKQVDFFYSFRAPEYLKSRREYQPFYKAGYEVFSIEFGANPLFYYPVPEIQCDLDYVFLASINPDKWNRYIPYLGSIFHEYSGLINGPGWEKIKKFTFNPGLDRYFYARAHVGINLHLDEQIQWANELNERTYMLAACGVPQLIDNPALLEKRFTGDCFFSAKTPQEYMDLFQYILENRDEAVKRTLKAQKQVFEQHTTFHRAEGFINKLSGIL